MTSGGRRAVVTGGKGRAANSGWRTVVADCSGGLWWRATNSGQQTADGGRRTVGTGNKRRTANGGRRTVEADRGGGPWRVGGEERAANSRRRTVGTGNKRRTAGGGLWRRAESRRRTADGEQQTANSGQEKAGDRRCAADFLQGREGCGDRASEIAEFNVSLYHAAEKRTI